MTDDPVDFTLPTLSDLQTDLILKEIELSNAREKYNDIRDTRKNLAEAINEEQKKSDSVIQDLYKQIAAEKARFEAAVSDLRNSRAEMQDDEFDARREVRRKEQELESIQRQVDQARRAAMATAEWKTLENRWDLLTMGAPWREWAKDHQIEGAKKITYEGRMILGDTMGLGKTLTSLIALDLIQAATKDAAPDNPIEFGSMK